MKGEGRFTLELPQDPKVRELALRYLPAVLALKRLSDVYQEITPSYWMPPKGTFYAVMEEEPDKPLTARMELALIGISMANPELASPVAWALRDFDADQKSSREALEVALAHLFRALKGRWLGVREYPMGVWVDEPSPLARSLILEILSPFPKMRLMDVRAGDGRMLLEVYGRIAQGEPQAQVDPFGRPILPRTHEPFLHGVDKNGLALFLAWANLITFPNLLSEERWWELRIRDYWEPLGLYPHILHVDPEGDWNAGSYYAAHLTPNGIMIALYPEEAASSEAGREHRQRMLERGRVAAALRLPEGEGILYVFRNELKWGRREILMGDLSDIPMPLEEAIPLVAQEIRSRDSQPTLLTPADPREITGPEYSLDPSHYLRGKEKKEETRAPAEPIPLFQEA